MGEEWEAAPADDAPDEAGVYLLQKEGEVLYVGQSKSIKRRFSQYVITNDPAIDVRYLLIADGKERLRKERELIEEYEPPLNKDNNASRNDYAWRQIQE